MLQALTKSIRDPLWAVDRIGLKLLPERGYARLRFGTAGQCRQRLQSAVEPDRAPLFVFPPPSVAWGYLFQRPQQMARALAAGMYRTDRRGRTVASSLISRSCQIPTAPRKRVQEEP